MKYLLKISLFLILAFLKMELNAQNLNKIGIQNGYIMLDRFHHKSDLTNIFYSTLIQTDILYLRQIYLNDKFNYNLGMGYSMFNFLPGSSSVLGHKNKTLSYLSLKSNFDIKVYKDKWNLSIGQTTYFLLNNVKQDDYFKPEKIDNLFIRKTFTNIDLGFNYSLSKKIGIGLTVPITLYPMYSAFQSTSPNSKDSEPYYLFVETTGINFIVSYILD